jgi:competence CoiA-like predicted nuclease
MVREKGKGSLKHKRLQKYLAEYFIKQGMIATVEPYIGKNVDVLVHDLDKTIAIEIQLSSKHCLQIEKDFQLGCDEVWFVCESSNILNNIKNKIKSNLGKLLFDKTRFYLIQDFFPHPNNNTNRITRNKVLEESNGIK